MVQHALGPAPLGALFQMRPDDAADGADGDDERDDAEDVVHGGSPVEHPEHAARGLRADYRKKSPLGA